MSRFVHGYAYALHTQLRHDTQSQSCQLTKRTFTHTCVKNDKIGQGVPQRFEILRDCIRKKQQSVGLILGKDGTTNQLRLVQKIRNIIISSLFHGNGRRQIQLIANYLRRDLRKQEATGDLSSNVSNKMQTFENLQTFQMKSSLITQDRKNIESFLQITSLSIYWSLKTQTISWIDAVGLKVCDGRFTRSLVLRFLSHHLKPRRWSMLAHVAPCFFHFGVQNPSLPFSDLSSSPGDLLTFWPQKTNRVQRSVVAKLRLGRVKNLDFWWSIWSDPGGT